MGHPSLHSLEKELEFLVRDEWREAWRERVKGEHEKEAGKRGREVREMK